MKSKIFLSVATLALLASCSTGYQARSWWRSGYSEIRTAPDSFIITYNGNEYTSSEEATKYTLLRAADLSLKNGYRYFVVLSTEDRTRSYQYSSTYENDEAYATRHRYIGQKSSSTYSGSVTRPGMTIRIKCFHEKPAGESIDAQYYWEQNSPD